ncbi:MAG: DsrE family protein [Bacteroidota bacterium]|nr:DsrE family protein [Bacteroidota bacterium]
MNKKLLFVFAFLFFSFQLFAQTTNKSEKVQHRVIIQLTSNDTLVWKGLMNNIKNMKNGWGDSVSIEVVAHGPGIDFLIKDKTTQQERIAFFKTKGVVFVGCENTLTERKISKESIIPEAGFVKMGIGEVILKQEQGWSYIKVGF